MVDWSFDDESRSISLEAGGVTGAVLPLFCFAIILGVWYCCLNNVSLECAFNLLSEISTVDRVVYKFHYKTHGERQGTQPHCMKTRTVLDIVDDRSMIVDNNSSIGIRRTYHPINCRRQII